MISEDAYNEQPLRLMLAKLLISEELILGVDQKDCGL